ncbi:hypothetical protein EV189_3291 [Motilibacter rhizosphaerae]|uniref:DUF2567 domain-containing protein n=1 Tax=Motilibacter rhizosphaerae TaxID=598652 RepID=A0A4Q7NGH7_9ACTN|nr:hypothetical protein EV189_3291 [Motilibacter rhizosphaerae]
MPYPSSRPVLPSARLARRPLEVRRGDLGLGAAVAAASAVLGLGAGLVWDRLAPHVSAADAAAGGAVPAYFGRDAWFAGTTLVAGILCALVAFVVLGTRSGSSLAVLLGLVVGGAAAAGLAWEVGRWLSPEQFRVAGPGGREQVRHAYGVLVAWPLAATVVHFALTAGFGAGEPRLEAAPDEESSPTAA